MVVNRIVTRINTDFQLKRWDIEILYYNKEKIKNKYPLPIIYDLFD